MNARSMGGQGVDAMDRMTVRYPDDLGHRLRAYGLHPERLSFYGARILQNHGVRRLRWAGPVARSSEACWA